MLADRVNVVEGLVDDLSRGQVPNLLDYHRRGRRRLVPAAPTQRALSRSCQPRQRRRGNTRRRCGILMERCAAPKAAMCWQPAIA
jgi:hypothetical protein